MGMNTILVTGGAGFIGSSLVDKLLEKGNKVVVIDNFNDYYDPKLKEKNIMDIMENMDKLNMDHDNLKIYRQDIRNAIKTDEVLKNYKIDIIIHLAAMAGVRYSIEAPQIYYDVNVNGTLNLLECVRKNNIKKLIFGSSSSVYGNNKKIPFSEDDSVDHPISPYAASKKACELLCYAYHYLYDIDIACLRFFTVYGPRQRPDLAIHKFTKAIILEEPVPIYGNGLTERDYTYIDDIVDGIMKTINWIKKEDNRYEIFNLGESRTIPLNEMVAIIEKILCKKANTYHFPMQDGDMERTFADISKASKFLGYFPNKTFEDGVVEFIKWFEAILV